MTYLNEAREALAAVLGPMESAAAWASDQTPHPGIVIEGKNIPKLMENLQTVFKYLKNLEENTDDVSGNWAGIIRGPLIVNRCTNCGALTQMGELLSEDDQNVYLCPGCTSWGEANIPC